MDIKNGIRNAEQVLSGRVLFPRVLSRNRRLCEEVAERAGPLDPGDFIADIGCGNGEFLGMFLSRYPGVRGFGMDRSMGMLKSAQKRFLKDGVAVELHYGDVQDAELPFERFNVVVSIGAISFWYDPVKTLDRIYNSVRPGGKLLVCSGRRMGFMKSIWNILGGRESGAATFTARTDEEMRSFSRECRFERADIHMDNDFIHIEFFKEHNP